MSYGKKSPFLRTAAHIFVSPGDGPAIITQCCMDGKTIQCLSNPSLHVPIYFQQFPSYSNRNCKKSPFSRTAAHMFVSPGDAPAIITQYVAWMERQFNACQTPRYMYLSIFNSFRVIRCLNQCWLLANCSLHNCRRSYKLQISCYSYGRPLSVSGRPCYILPMFSFIYLFIYLFYGCLILRPWWTEVRESFTRGGPWVPLKKLLLGFFPGHP